MIREKKLGSGLYFSAEQLFPAALLVLCAFLKTVAVTMMETGAVVLFLTQSLEYLPQILIAAAVLMMILWPALSAAKEKSDQVPIILLSIAGLISVLFYAASFFVYSWIFGWSLMVWKYGFLILAETAFWMTAFRFGVFGKKSNVLAAVLIAHLAGWLAAAGLIRLITEDPNLMILWSGILAIGSAAALKILIDNGSAPILNRFTFDKQKIKRQGSDSLQRKLSAVFFIASGLIFFAVGFYQYNFLINIGFVTTFYIDAPLPAGYSSIFSILYTVSAVLAALALIIFVTRRHLSLFAGLFLLPIVLLTASCAVYSPVFLICLAQSLFVFAIFAKEAALQAVPWAVSPRTGFRATLLRKSVIEPVALALSGLFLLAVQNSISGVETEYLQAGLAVIILLAVVILRKFYQNLILNMLKTHLWRGGKLLLAGKAINRLLQENLNSSDSQSVLYTLRVIEESKASVLSDYLKKALHHTNEDVRLYALSKIEELKLTAVLNEVIELAQKDNSMAVRQNAARVMCRLGGAEEREKAVLLINDPVLREGILTGLLAVGQEGVFVAIKCVADLSVSENKDDRLSAAAALGNAGNPAFYHPLTYLLTDSDPDVCKAALSASGKLANPLLLPTIMQTFRFPELRENASETLLQFKETAFNEISTVLNSTDFPIQFRILLIRLAARIASPAAEEFLFSHIQIADRRIRFNIIKALALSGYKATGKKINIVRLCLYDEMETATGILAAIHVFNKNKDQKLNASLDILKSALNGEIEYIKERILLLLALLQPSKALIGFLSTYNPTVPEDEITVKIVDKLLSGELRTLCLPLFENKTLQQRLALLRPQFYPPVLSVNGHIQDILKTPAGELTDWTRACAVYAAGNINDISFVNALTELLSDADTMIRETAVWALGKILPCEEAARLITGNINDSSVYVARMARFVADGTGQTSFLGV
ncbi:MAG: HEAT repeat domain-containing protein [Alphaproteobacteria bacterium]|nr:HEAT repeat domain-containing protein [Alphaproteobacteria bacterium]